MLTLGENLILFVDFHIIYIFIVHLNSYRNNATIIIQIHIRSPTNITNHISFYYKAIHLYYVLSSSVSYIVIISHVMSLKPQLKPLPHKKITQNNDIINKPALGKEPIKQ